MRHTYYIKGMSCQGCRKHVEKSLASIPGVLDVSVDLEKEEARIDFESHIPTIKLQQQLTADGGHYQISDDPYSRNSEFNNQQHTPVNLDSTPGIYYCPMQCEGDKTYQKAGDCPICGMDLVRSVIQHSEEKNVLPTLKKKVFVAVLFTTPILFVAMSEMITNNPLYTFLSPKIWNWIQFVLSLPVVFYSCWMFFERAYNSIKTWNLNMFTLIGIGAGVAWVFSVVSLLIPDIFPIQFKTESGTVYVYFEAATVILTLVLLGQLMEARAHGKTSSALRELLQLAPNKAFKVEEGIEKEVKLETIQVGDILRVKPGEKVPIDGVLIEGSAVVNESMITGEPIPVTKVVLDRVIGGTINGTNTFLMRADKIGSDTLLSQIINMVNEASRSRAPIQNLTDMVSRYFVISVVVIALITFVIWAIWGPYPALVFAFLNAIAVLIIACPCALGLATPMSVMVGVGRGAKQGILFKNATALQQLSKISVLLIDKTGTLTEGKPIVSEFNFSSEDYTGDQLIQYLGSLSQMSEHPLSEAVMRFSRNKGKNFPECEDFLAYPGMGITANIHGKQIAMGNDAMVQFLHLNIPQNMRSEVLNYQQQGKTVSFLVIDSSVAGYIVISDTIKESSRKAVKELREKGIDVVMLTGDNVITAKHVADELELSDYKASLLPENKLEEVKRLQLEGNLVAMAGDGINDAPALAQSDVGIAMGTGTDVAIESADITLVKGDIGDIYKAIRLSKLVMRNIRQNLFLAIIYNALGIPLAAGVLYPALGILLSPMIAAVAMSFSSVSVITNSLRLRTTVLTK